MLFKDVSQITLKNRYALRPLLEKPRERDLKYSWHFPFALTVTYNGHQYVLRTPADLPELCEALDMEHLHLLDWYAEFLHIPQVRSPPASPFVSPDKMEAKKFKQNLEAPKWGLRGDKLKMWRVLARTEVLILVFFLCAHLIADYALSCFFERKLPPISSGGAQVLFPALFLMWGLVVSKVPRRLCPTGSLVLRMGFHCLWGPVSSRGARVLCVQQLILWVGPAW